MPRLALILSALLSLCTVATAADQEVRTVIRTPKGEAIPDAVLALYSLDAADTVPLAPATPIEISQQGQEFIPYVTVVRLGSEVIFPNKDTIQHHIYSLSKPKRFEKPLYAPGSHESVVFDQPGIVTLGCNIHDWMVAYIVVLPTPYFAKSDANGAAQVAVPVGRYRIEIWHPRVTAPDVREAVIGPGLTSIEVALKLKPDRRIRRSPESKAGGY